MTSHLLVISAETLFPDKGYILSDISNTEVKFGWILFNQLQTEIILLFASLSDNSEAFFIKTATTSRCLLIFHVTLYLSWKAF